MNTTLHAGLHIAKFELCRELYELSGWTWTDYYYTIFEYRPQDVVVLLGKAKDGLHIPAYEIGYLIERLPQKVNGARLVLAGMPMSGRWGCAYLYGLNISFDASQIADTPQDAACSLAIVLWRQGILVRQQ